MSYDWATGESMHQVALFDTYSVFFRAFHALPPMNTAAGAPTSALYGFSVLLLKILREHAPSELAFALDLPQKTFRHELFAPYKAQRQSPPSPLLEQLRRLPELLATLEVPVHGAVGFEADDVLATLTKRALSVGHEVLIVTGDRDLFQLARDGARILFLGARGKEATLCDVATVLERRGVSPPGIPALIALAGDTSDNIPGIPGVGERTAKRLVREFGTIERLLANLALVQPANLRQTLDRHREQLVASELLARLRDDVDLGPGPASAPLERGGLLRLRAQFEQLEFRSLLSRVDALMKS